MKVEPGRHLQQQTRTRKTASTVAAWIAAEWKMLAAYLIGSALVFVGVFVSQHYWPNETMELWGVTWRLAAILVGANLVVLLALEASLRGVEKRDGFEDADGNCTVCGVGPDEKCLPVRAAR